MFHFKQKTMNALEQKEPNPGGEKRTRVKKMINDIISDTSMLGRVTDECRGAFMDEISKEVYNIDLKEDYSSPQLKALWKVINETRDWVISDLRDNMTEGIEEIEQIYPNNEQELIQAFHDKVDEIKEQYNHAMKLKEFMDYIQNCIEDLMNIAAFNRVPKSFLEGVVNSIDPFIKGVDFKTLPEAQRDLIRGTLDTALMALERINSASE